MRSAFTLIELIFVIVLIGVLTGIGFYMSRPDYTRQDAQYTLLKLKEARYRAMGNDTLDPSGCVTLTPSALSSDDAPKHEIKSAITMTPNVTTVCFDAKGRPHDGNSVTLDTLIHSPLNIFFNNGDKNSTIRLFSGTGYAIIPCNN
ncbi:prepilin-type N-terminal cleavage/methylation domain-containing protein [Sulfuricurvum sp.]|uniref:prepilin-type N-terminal cleavage/methylation domain-containing protein n=1 Tax=Sulfuricurvum sp. TaxID=2025608 RepID=UPI002627C214|nr:prepilin-type N-terminal cleavage/methylation domain-containing protein [Sulfuricurvum sp.]MDD2265919.1 prepilin-type N-terminal cleavage/methylation domain-containing protein [Sulfuricurvum sp.]MDD2782925.1 prepilin-type N-terminal cleavage/methylation domain-containing protein [Sulfuricurvum sp.]